MGKPLIPPQICHGHLPFFQNFSLSLPVNKRPSTAFYSSDLFQLGIGYVMVCRFKATGACKAGVFLVDVFCLGAKNAFFTKIERLDFEDLIHKIFQGPPTEIPPEC